MVTQALKILLVYDDAESRSLIEQVLAATDIERFELDCVSSQLLPQNASGRIRYDICLLDSHAGRSGPITRAIRVTFNCPIIMLTHDSGVEILNALHCGVSDCLIKENLTASLLEETICSVVEQARTSATRDKYERWYLGLVENSADVIYTMDLEGYYTSMNTAGEKLTGFAREEILIMNFRQLVAPDYIYLAWGALGKMLEDRKPTAQDVDIVTKLGDRVFVRMANHLIYRDGTPIGIQGIARELAGSDISFPTSAGRISRPFSFSEPTR